MPKFAVYGIATASKFIGNFEAATPEEAIDKAQEEGDYHISLCHQCAREVEVGDIHEEQVDKIED